MSAGTALFAVPTLHRPWQDVVRRTDVVGLRRLPVRGRGYPHRRAGLDFFGEQCADVLRRTVLAGPRQLREPG